MSCDLRRALTNPLPNFSNQPSLSHLYRALGNIPLSTIEITAMQMVLTMNLTSFAWSVYDGQMRKEEDCDSQQKSMRIEKMPSLIEFFGYWSVSSSTFSELSARLSKENEGATRN